MANRSDDPNRRRELAAARQTDRERWSDKANLDPAWDRRAQLAASLIPRGAHVLDLGCGAMALERFLPAYCRYLPCDLVARDARTLVCDFNAGEFPAEAECDIAVALGVLEYLADVPAFLAKLRALGKPVVVSYHPAGEGPADRRGLGWVNDYARRDLPDLLKAAGFVGALLLEIGNGQVLMRLRPEGPARRAEKTVWAVSYSNVGNFGDRLGPQLLSHVLPPHASLRHISHENLTAHREGAPDLLIIGLGNSLYADLLTDELQQLIDAAPLSIGIFGTQYRDAMPTERLSALIDRLSTWYARSEEDLLIYGRGRPNVRHLGDWLVDAFPLARGYIDQLLEVRSSEVTGAPLDRLIEHIQRYKRVSSTRLHPLLCALASAEAVAYQEQEEMAGAGVSGKFRSLLIDIFGREPPARELWRVDREAVVIYKTKVRQNLEALRQDLARLLA